MCRWDINLNLLSVAIYVFRNPLIIKQAKAQYKDTFQIKRLMNVVLFVLNVLILVFSVLPAILHPLPSTPVICSTGYIQVKTKLRHK